MCIPYVLLEPRAFVDVLARCKNFSVFAVGGLTRSVSCGALTAKAQHMQLPSHDFHCGTPLQAGVVAKLRGILRHHLILACVV